MNKQFIKMKNMKIQTKWMMLLLVTAITASACGRDDDPIPDIKPSDGTKLTLEGGPGEGDAENAVYVDLSAEKQTAVKRVSWDLGFYSGGAFRVILNNQTAIAAIETDKTDINAVNSTNTDLDQLASGFTPDKMKLYDDTAGRIEHTVIKEISGTDSENAVYIVHRVFASSVDKENVWKIRILRNGDTGYTLQYAKIDDSSFQTAEISKDATYNFNFFSFTSGTAAVEPAKEEWDFVWSKSMYKTGMGAQQIPYTFSDLIFTNHLAGVKAQQIIFENEEGTSTGNPTYEDFAETDLSGLALSAQRNVIASNWRVTTDDEKGAFHDRYYIIQDVSGNIYKLRFLSMGAGKDGGTRGYPELEYQLVKSK